MIINLLMTFWPIGLRIGNNNYMGMSKTNQMANSLHVVKDEPNILDLPDLCWLPLFPSLLGQEKLH